MHETQTADVYLLILTILLDHSMAKQLQRTTEQTHYSGSVPLTHTHCYTHIQRLALTTQGRPAETSEEPNDPVYNR